MEIGSFIDLQLPQGLEYYKGERNLARLNSGRAAIYHAVRILGCNTIWLPYYQCDTVRNFLIQKGIAIKYYNIDENFTPVNIEKKEDDAVLFVNYFGVMSLDRMYSIACNYKNVIIDNSQAFFCKPVSGVMNVYSARKFVGVPDGGYLIGASAERYTNEYAQGYSSDTSSFLLQRCEYGCEGKAYQSKLENDHRIDSEDVMKMSSLTMKILDGTDYDTIIKRRCQNFEYASTLFAGINKIDPLKYYEESCVPMVYPLVVEDDSLMERLQKNKHFQGHWWSYLLDEMPTDSFEYWIARYIIPITIDQRYGKEEISYLEKIIL